MWLYQWRMMNMSKSASAAFSAFSTTGIYGPPFLVDLTLLQNISWILASSSSSSSSSSRGLSSAGRCRSYERAPVLTILRSTIGRLPDQCWVVNRIQRSGARCGAVGPIGGSRPLSKGPHRPHGLANLSYCWALVYHFTVTVNVRIRVRFRFSDRVGIGLLDVQWVELA